MDLNHYINFGKKPGISGLFYAIGSFGVIDGVDDYTYTEKDNVKKYVFSNGKVELCATFTAYQNGVVLRRDSIRNLTDSPTAIHHLASRFCLKGNKYQVYTQFNAWQHESDGEWQKLVTEVSASGRGMRSCDGAAPIMALFDEYSARSTVFHLLPNCQWRMSAKKLPIYNQRETVTVEIGFCDEGLCFELAANETVYLPTILFYGAKNKTDLDAYKLHEVYNKLYPRKTTPVLYNSWLYCYDFLDIDALLQQADVAAELGIEAFMIDAGWFGNGGNWSDLVGDWSENTTGGPCGRLLELADHVREKGMIFGLWFEPERAGKNSQTRRDHPEYYIQDKIFDFTNPEARAYMLDTLCSQIDKYGIGWVKLDFNDTLPHDEKGTAFYRYFEGQTAFLAALKAKYPDLYITGCASGGYRMEMAQGTLCDSFWLSDNQSPVAGLRIVKDTLKRLPCALIERWCVQKYCEGFLQYGQKEKVGRMLYCNNGTWDSLTTVSDAYIQAFMTGGPIGFSFDLASLPEKYKAFWKDAIAEFKKNRAFYASCTARLLADTDGLVAIQYADAALDTVLIQIFTTTSRAGDLLLYPCVDESAEYLSDGARLLGKELAQNGLSFEKLSENSCVTLTLKKV